MRSWLHGLLLLGLSVMTAEADEKKMVYIELRRK
jgi:hypothetical protein